MRTATVFAALCLGMVSISSAPAQEAVLIIRHAEKEARGDDPRLTDAGRDRAADWATVLASARIDVVVNTDAARSRETGEIIAAALDAGRAEVRMADVAGLIDLLAFDHAGDTVLVVAHTETIPGILRHLGVRETVALATDDFSHLFVVTAMDADPPAFLHLRMP